jgi:hypothetical protein
MSNHFFTKLPSIFTMCPDDVAERSALMLAQWLPMPRPSDPTPIALP